MVAAPTLPRRATGLWPVGLDGAPLLAALIAVAWLLVDPRSPDLAAQVYRVDLFRHAGFAVWDNNWYAGHHLPGYSLTFPAMAALVGLRPLGALAVITSTVLFAGLVRGRFGPQTRFATAWFAVAASGDLWIGRLTFALGVTAGLAAALAAARHRPRLAALLAAACAATSPVAGLFLALAGVALAVAARRPCARSVALVVPPLLLVGALAVLFPEGGVQPFALTSFLAAAGATVAFVVLLPRQERVLRTGGVLYALAVLASLLPLTPMGSNVVRLGVMFTGPLLLCALAGPGRARLRDRRLVAALAVAGAGLAAWTITGPVVQSLRADDDPSVRAAYYLPVERFLAARHSTPVRVEVPFTRAHWESVFLGRRYLLARGWERQLDVKYDGLFDGPLTAAAYHRWLATTGVAYVALPDVPLDGTGRLEAALVRHGLPFLTPVLRTRHWRIYAVRGHAPLVWGPGRVTSLGRDRFALRARRAGRFVVRLRYTPYWTVTAGRACVAPTHGGWTAVDAAGPGPVRIAARWSLGAALRDAPACLPPAAG
ncbi:hypothetical protein NBH00_17080 [Paraconexibacter antarcticus]|uniref:Integral membrane protein n=1 Tax=Paraconexibacter antarcticus TaxID=2949664 RepID=A0ABY5DPS1_9ACTN|nr:hypothetical protein [Paraconexibacter antarcticus]UTI63067.1 hypothetical protein NBH00_17080 [Paraconexibacter antarcticus]